MLGQEQNFFVWLHIPTPDRGDLGGSEQWDGDCWVPSPFRGNLPEMGKEYLGIVPGHCV